MTGKRLMLYSDVGVLECREARVGVGSGIRRALRAAATAVASSTPSRPAAVSQSADTGTPRR